jgi:hypothetical protein
MAMPNLSPQAAAIETCWRALRRSEQALARHRKARTLSGHRDGLRDRRARTRWLIELGGLVVKAGLPDLTDDDRATMLGGFLALRDQLTGIGGDPPAAIKQRWRRRGLRTFDADAAAKAEGGAGQGSAGDSRGNASGGGREKEDDGPLA